MIDYKYDKVIGNQIRLLRIKMNLTQDALAAKLQLNEIDITRSALAKIEAGQRHVYAFELKAFKDIFDTTYEELLP